MDITEIANDKTLVGLIMTGILGLGALIGSLFKNFRNKRFEESIKRVYPVIQEYFQSINKFRDNIELIPIEVLQNKNAEELNKWITYPLYDLISKTLMLEMFLDKEDRKCVQMIMKASQEFHVALRIGLEQGNLENRYFLAKGEFSLLYQIYMEKLIDLFHTRLHGKWYYIF